MMSRVLAAVVVTLTLAACGGDDPQVPTTFAPAGTSTSAISGTVAQQAGNAPQVKILDAKGRGIKGLRVRWKVGQNSGSVVNDSTTTDGAGVALSGGWTLGTSAGTQTLTATADGVSPVVFTAQVAPGPAANIVRVAGDGQQATVNTNVATPPSARAQDIYGNPVPGATVNFGVVTGNGTITGSQQVTDANGVATLGSWKLGTTAGPQLVSASSGNATPVTFQVIGLAGPAADLQKLVGDNQQALISTAVPVAPGVRVVDAFNNPVGNVPVTFTPGPNSGTVTFGTTVTDPATGGAFVGSWVLSAAPAQTLVATSTSLPGKSVTFSVAAIETAFNVEVRFIGEGGTAAVRQAFVNAANKWRKVIVGHVHDLVLNYPAGTCLSWVPAINETVKDVVIFARIGPIDGVGKILAQAGPCLIGNASLLPVTGVMEFDEADVTTYVNNGVFGDIVLHEMGHVLGVGTLWDYGRSLLVDAGSAAPYFVGTGARAAFTAVNTVTFGGNSVPVEGNAAPIGTRDGHWRESVFGRELMQGYAKLGGMPLSRVTAASLQDLGYVVNFNNVDPFTITSPILAGFNAVADPGQPIGERLFKPKEGVAKK